jgi:hypothetical protein
VRRWSNRTPALISGVRSLRDSDEGPTVSRTLTADGRRS